MLETALLNLVEVYLMGEKINQGRVKRASEVILMS